MSNSASNTKITTTKHAIGGFLLNCGVEFLTQWGKSLDKSTTHGYYSPHNKKE